MFLRPLLVLIIAVVVLGSVQSLMWFQRSIPRRQAEDILTVVAEGAFQVRVTLTFDAVGDAFAPESLVIQHEGQELYRSEERIPAGQEVVLEDVEGIKLGENRFYLAAVGSEQPTQPRAVRFQVLRDGQVIGQQIFWGEPGEPVEGELVVDARWRPGASDE